MIKKRSAKVLNLIFVLLAVVLLSSCANTDPSNILKRENIFNDNIIKQYKPYNDDSVYIYLFEYPSGNDDGNYTGGLITITKKRNSSKYEKASFDYSSYSDSSKSKKFFVSYYRPYDRFEVNMNYVVGGYELISDISIKKPYIEFDNGDIILIDNYCFTDNKFYYYLDLGIEYVNIIDSRVTIENYEVKFVEE